MYHRVIHEGMHEVSPKSMVLDLLRVTPRDWAVPVRALVNLGGMFGFHANAVRVAIARLVSARLLESDEHGSYRLARRAEALNRFVNEWRLGDDRTCAWRGEWIALAPARSATRPVRRRSQRAMTRLGFAQGLDGLWVRPDNLTLSREALTERLDGLGLTPNSELFVVRDPSPTLAGRWQKLWPVQRLQSEYRGALRDLQRSTKRLRSMPSERALVEAFLLGGAAIRLLALDPLLPDEIMSSRPRRSLAEAMLAYDELGRSTWGGHLETAALVGAPSHLRIVQEANA